MPQLRSLSLLFALASALLVAALPTNDVYDVRDVITPAEHKFPRGTFALAYDEEEAMIHAFNENMEKLVSIPTSGQPKRAVTSGAPPKTGRSTKKVRRQDPVGTCSALSVAEAESLPGWSNLAAIAKTQWGGSYGVVTNPTDIPDSPANSCVQADSVIVSTDDNPTCQNQTQSTGGTLVGTSGTISLADQQGTTYSLTTTVTTTSSLSLGESVSVAFQFPDLVDVTSISTVTGTFTNDQSKAETNTLTNTQTATVTMNAAAGEECALTFQSTTCTQDGTGSVAFIASGWVWFDYGSRVQGHYKWALSIDGILDVGDRSSSASFNLVMSSKTLSDYEGSCA